MADPKEFLQQLHQNLATLEARRAKYAWNAPLDLLNQIDDHRTAIDLTEQVIAGHLTAEAWQTALLPLLISVAPFRAAQQIVLIIGSDTPGQATADLSAAVLDHLRQTPKGAIIADEFIEEPATYQMPVAKALVQAFVRDEDLAGRLKQLLAAYSAASRERGSGGGDIITGDDNQ